MPSTLQCKEVVFCHVHEGHIHDGPHNPVERHRIASTLVSLESAPGITPTPDLPSIKHPVSSITLRDQ